MKRHATVIVAAILAATPAISQDVSGATTGIFVNPQPAASSVTTGVGTSQFTFGEPAGTPANHLYFTGNDFTSPLETPFKVGSLSYFNGATYNNPSSVDFTLSLAFTAPALPTVSSTFTLNLVSTTNDGDADAQADYVYFPSSFSTTSFVLDGTTYNVKLLGFGNVVGDGFLDSDSTQLHVRENSTASADIFAVVTSETPNSGVPEPASWAMMLGGFGMIGGALRNRRKVAVSFG